MFLHYFQFTSQPFAERVSAAALWQDDRMQQGLARLRYLAEQATVGLVTGASGVGKSALVKRFLHDLQGPRWQPVRMPRWMTAVAFTLLLAAGGLLGLFAVSQTLVGLAQLAIFPWYSQWLIGLAISLLASAVLYSVIRMAWLYYRLRRVEQVPIEALRRLAQRASLRQDSQSPLGECKKAAMEQLKVFLANYAEAEPRLVSLAKEVHLGDAIDRVRSERDNLLNTRQFANYDIWLEQFVDRFQCQLDEVATARVRLHAWRVGLKTAVSPNAFVDLLIATYYGFSMIADLCSIYNARAGRTSTAILLAWIFLNAYVAGQTQELEDIADEQIDNLFTQMTQWQVGGLIAGKVGSRAASGIFNYLMLRRLGRVAMRMLQPAAAQ